MDGYWSQKEGGNSMTENAFEPYEELAPDVDDDLDDTVSPNLGKVIDVELPDYDPEFDLEGDHDANN